VFFEIIRRQDSIMTITNTSSKGRSIIANVDLPRLVHFVTAESVWCNLWARLWYEVYPTNTGPTGAWTQAFGDVQNAAFCLDPNVSTQNTGMPDYPFQATWGGGTYGPGWWTPTGTVFPILQGGGYGLSAKMESMGHLSWIGGNVPVGHSIAMTYSVVAQSPFNPDASILVGPGVPDTPYVASYTNILSTGVLNAVMI
jgi:hypothetical protein